LPPAAAKLNFFRAAFSLILRSKINENAALKNIIWRRKPPNDVPEAFYTTPEQKSTFGRRMPPKDFSDSLIQNP